MNLKIYVDMDGVIADFNGAKNAVERFENEEKFFYRLKPLKNNVKFLKKIEKRFDVTILSKSPNMRTHQDKLKWLKKYGIKSPAILIPNSMSKNDFVNENEMNILFDDYGKNCREFDKVGKGVKVVDSLELAFMGIMGELLEE